MPSNAEKIRKKKEELKKYNDSQNAIIKKLAEVDIKRTTKALGKHDFWLLELSDKQLDQVAKCAVDEAKRLIAQSSESHKKSATNQTETATNESAVLAT